MTEMNETNPSTVLPGQERYVAPLDETPLKAVDSMDESAPASNMWADAWRTLRKNPLFIISGLLIIFIVFVALFPSVLTKQNPNYCTLDNSLIIIPGIAIILPQAIRSASTCKVATYTPVWSTAPAPR